MRCRNFDISLNPYKFIFGVTKGNLLGHIVSDSGINIDPRRIVVILNLPAPTSKKEVQDFMGVITFVHRFVPNFVVMFNPIHNIVKFYLKRIFCNVIFLLVILRSIGKKICVK